jgi:hypothetical protein
MDDDNALPTDLAECHQLLLVAFQQAEELSRVLDDTAASYEELQATHRAALEELSALKRWIYGRRTEKIIEGEGQRHLFDLRRTGQPSLTACRMSARSLRVSSALSPKSPQGGRERERLCPFGAVASRADCSRARYRFRFLRDLLTAERIPNGADQSNRSPSDEALLRGDVL